MSHTPYKNKKGDRVPSVTTIISRFDGEKVGPLMDWAWRKGMKGIDYRQARDDAADVGTICHEMVECFIRKIKFDPSKYESNLVEEAKVPFKSFLEWQKTSKLKPAKTEVRLVSEQYQYGGMIDAVQLNGELVILDWKTSNGIYVGYLIQLAAYRNLWNECMGKQIRNCCLVRFGKIDVDFSHRLFSENVLDRAFDVFRWYRECYDALNELKRRMA